MSKENNLTDFLTDLGSAIKDMRGTGKKINAQDYSKEVRAIGPLQNYIDINSNGEHDVKDYKIARVVVENADYLTLKTYIERTSNEIHIPYGITKIGGGAFYSAESPRISKYYIPVTVTEIERSSLYGNNKELFHIFYEGSLTDFFKIVKGKVVSFDYMSICGTAYYKLYINNELVNDFDLSNFVSQEIPIGFLSSMSFTGTVYVPKTVKIINQGAFYGIKAFDTTKIEFEEGTELTVIRRDSFSYLNAPKMELTLPRCLEYEMCSFEYCKVKKLHLGEGATKLPAHMLDYFECEELIIPKSITRIEGSFSDYAKLGKTLIIPENVDYIGNYAIDLQHGQKLTIYMKSTTPPIIDRDSFYSGTFTFYVPKGTSATYKSATNWSRHASKIYEEYQIIMNVPNELLNNESISYSLDNGVTYQQFTNGVLLLEQVAIVKIKSTNANQKVLVGTSAGASDVGTISNSEITLSFTTDTNVYLTIQ